jgi:hypothetical protein
VTNAIITAAQAAELSEAVEQKRRDLLGTIQAYERYIADKRKQLDEVEARCVGVFEVKARLEAAGFRPRYDSWGEVLRVDVEREQLTDLYRVLGRFDGKNAERDIEDARRRLIRVQLTPVNYKFVSVSYVTKLPRKGAKCRIETVKVKASTRKQLVCEV